MCSRSTSMRHEFFTLPHLCVCSDVPIGLHVQQYLVALFPFTLPKRKTIAEEGQVQRRRSWHQPQQRSHTHTQKCRRHRHHHGHRMPRTVRRIESERAPLHCARTSSRRTSIWHCRVAAVSSWRNTQRTILRFLRIRRCSRPDTLLRCFARLM